MSLLDPSFVQRNASNAIPAAAAEDAAIRRADRRQSMHLGAAGISARQLAMLTSKARARSSSSSNRRHSSIAGQAFDPTPRVAVNDSHILHAPTQAGHSHALAALGEWTGKAVSEDATFGDQLGGSRRGASLADVLILKAQQYSVFHDELARQAALHCPPLASLLLRVWAGFAIVADKAISRYEAADASAVTYKERLENTITTLGPRVESLTLERDELRSKINDVNDELEDIRTKLRAQGKTVLLREQEADAARNRLEEFKEAVLNGTANTNGSAFSSSSEIADATAFDEEGNPTGVSRGISKLLQMLDDVEAERAYQRSLVDEQSVLLNQARFSMLLSGLSRMPVPQRSIGVQCNDGDATGDGSALTDGGPSVEISLLPIPRKAVKRVPDVPFEFRVLMSVFTFARPVRPLSLPLARRLFLQLLLDKGSYDRATLPVQGFRLSLAQYVCEYYGHKYGLPQLSDMRVSELITSVRAHALIDVRARIFDMLCAAVVSRRDGRPLLNQSACDFIVGIFDDLRASKVLSRERVTGTGSAVTPLELDGTFFIPRAAAVRIARARFAFAPRSTIVRLSAEISLLPSPGDSHFNSVLSLGDAMTTSSTTGSLLSSVSGTINSLIDLDAFLRLMLCEWITEQVAWEDRIAAAFDRYSRSGLPHHSVLADDMGVQLSSHAQRLVTSAGRHRPASASSSATTLSVTNSQDGQRPATAQSNLMGSIDGDVPEPLRSQSASTARPGTAGSSSTGRPLSAVGSSHWSGSAADAGINQNDPINQLPVLGVEDGDVLLTIVPLPGTKAAKELLRDGSDNNRTPVDASAVTRNVGSGGDGKPVPRSANALFKGPPVRLPAIIDGAPQPSDAPLALMNSGKSFAAVVGSSSSSTGGANQKVNPHSVTAMMLPPPSLYPSSNVSGSLDYSVEAKRAREKEARRKKAVQLERQKLSGLPDAEGMPQMRGSLLAIPMQAALQMDGGSGAAGSGAHGLATISEDRGGPTPNGNAAGLGRGQSFSIAAAGRSGSVRDLSRAGSADRPPSASTLANRPPSQQRSNRQGLTDRSLASTGLLQSSPSLGLLLGPDAASEPVTMTNEASDDASVVQPAARPRSAFNSGGGLDSATATTPSPNAFLASAEGGSPATTPMQTMTVAAALAPPRPLSRQPTRSTGLGFGQSSRNVLSSPSRSGTAASGTGAAPGSGGGAVVNSLGDTLPISIPSPPGVTPGLGYDGHLYNLRFDHTLPIFRPEDQFFVDADSYADNKHVRDGTGVHLSGQAAAGFGPGSAFKPQHLKSLVKGADDHDAAAAATEASRLASPLTALESPVPTSLLAPETLLAIVEGLSDTDPDDILAAQSAARDDDRPSYMQPISRKERRRGSTDSNGGSSGSGSAAAAGSDLGLLKRARAQGRRKSSIDASASSSNLLALVSAEKANSKSGVPRASSSTSGPTLHALGGLDALRGHARRLADHRAQLAAAKRSKKRITLADCLSLFRHSEPWLPEDRVRKMFEHARWRLEEASHALACSGWESANTRSTGSQYWYNARTGATSTVPPVIKRVPVIDLDWTTFAEMCLRHGLMRCLGPGAAGFYDMRADAATRVQRWWRRIRPERTGSADAAPNGGYDASSANAAVTLRTVPSAALFAASGIDSMPIYSGYRPASPDEIFRLENASSSNDGGYSSSGPPPGSASSTSRSRAGRRNSVSELIASQLCSMRDVKHGMIEAGGLPSHLRPASGGSILGVGEALDVGVDERDDDYTDAALVSPNGFALAGSFNQMNGNATGRRSSFSSSRHLLGKSQRRLSFAGLMGGSAGGPAFDVDSDDADTRGDAVAHGLNGRRASFASIGPSGPTSAGTGSFGSCADPVAELLSLYPRIPSNMRFDPAYAAKLLADPAAAARALKPMSSSRNMLLDSSSSSSSAARAGPPSGNTLLEGYGGTDALGRRRSSLGQVLLSRQRSVSTLFPPSASTPSAAEAAAGIQGGDRNTRSFITLAGEAAFVPIGQSLPASHSHLSPPAGELMFAKLRDRLDDILGPELQTQARAASPSPSAVALAPSPGGLSSTVDVAGSLLVRALSSTVTPVPLGRRGSSGSDIATPVPSRRNSLARS